VGEIEEAFLGGWGGGELLTMPKIGFSSSGPYRLANREEKGRPYGAPDAERGTRGDSMNS